MFCENSNVKRQNFFLDQRDHDCHRAGASNDTGCHVTKSRGQAMVRTLPVYDNGRGFQNTFCLVYQIKFSNLKIHVLNIAIVVFKS